MRQDMTSPLPPEVAEELAWLPFDEDESAVWKHIRSLTRDLAAARAEAEGEVARLREDAEKWRAFVASVDAELAVAASEKFCDALGVLRDARRYRWLREQNAHLESPDAWTITRCDFTDEEGPNRYWVGSDLDAAIDAALGGNANA